MTHPADLAADEAQFAGCLPAKWTDLRVEKRFIRKSGEVIWTDLSVGCVRKPDRSVEYMIALLHDISERKQAEEALHETNAYLEKLDQLCQCADHRLGSTFSHHPLQPRL